MEAGDSPLGALVSGRTLLLPLDGLYPECPVLTQGHPQIKPFACIQDSGCHLGMNARCMETLARRLDRLFTAHPALESVLLHWRLRDGTCWGIAFDRQLSTPRVSRVRPSYLSHYLRAGTPFQVPPEVFG